MDFEIADVLRATSHEGPGSGYDKNPFRLTGVTWDHPKRRAIWEGFDIAHVLQEPGVMVDDGDAVGLMVEDEDAVLTMR
jgi:hypothetical protein